MGFVFNTNGTSEEVEVKEVTAERHMAEETNDCLLVSTQIVVDNI